MSWWLGPSFTSYMVLPQTRLLTAQRQNISIKKPDETWEISLKDSERLQTPSISVNTDTIIVLPSCIDNLTWKTAPLPLMPHHVISRSNTNSPSLWTLPSSTLLPSLSPFNYIHMITDISWNIILFCTKYAQDTRMLRPDITGNYTHWFIKHCRGSCLIYSCNCFLNAKHTHP